MSSLLSDQYWLSTANFLEKHIKGEDNLLAPIEFKKKFPNTYPYGKNHQQDANNFQWLVIHEGMMESIDHNLLKHAKNTLRPVFANEVFVVFSSRKEISELNSDSVHVAAFQEMMESMKPFKDSGNLSIHTTATVEPGKIFSNIRDIASTSRDSIELCSRTASQTVYLGNETLLCRVLTKYMCYVEAKDRSLTPHLCLNGYWETWITQAIIRILQPDWYCIDIGANCGYHSLLMADCVSSSGHVLLVEPNPRLASLLERTMDINGFRDYTKISEKAVSDRAGEKVNLVIPRGFWGSATICEDATEQDQSFEVETTTLDELTKEWPRVDLIKIDAEGAEEAIWKGMHETIRRNRNITLIVEFTYDTYSDTKGFLENIQAEGFLLRYIDDDSQIKSLTVEQCLNGHPSGFWMLFLRRE